MEDDSRRRPGGQESPDIAKTVMFVRDLTPDELLLRRHRVAPHVRDCTVMAYNPHSPGDVPEPVYFV